jgi:hypothetical protein
MVKTVVDMKGMANDRGTSATAAPFLPTLAGGGEALRHDIRQAKAQVTGGAGRNRPFFAAFAVPIWLILGANQA